MAICSVDQLKVEYMSNPAGIDDSLPRLGWNVKSSRRGARQTAYQIIAASDLNLLHEDKADVWNTGKVDTDQSQHIVYAGKPLVSEGRYCWAVRIWDELGQVSEWSGPAEWTMGLLERSRWQGKWIGLRATRKPTIEQPNGAVYLRKRFALRGPVERATVYATAQGVYRLFVNGKRAGNDSFAPEWTDYRVRVLYQAYDVTDLLAQGDNAIGIMLGHGWFSGYIGMFGYQKYGNDPGMLMQLNVVYADGSRESIVTDGTWKASSGSITASDIQMGEEYDARLEMPGWDTAAFVDEQWKPCSVFSDFKGWIVAHRGPRIEVTQELSPIAITLDPDGKTIVDLGQNITGWLRFSVTAQSGTKITLRYGEVLDRDGRLYTENLRKARQTDVYIAKGDGIETYEPYFTCHGFRYVELSGYPGQLSGDQAKGVVVHSAVAETGELTTSNPLVNRLIENILWTNRANFMSVPSDCPQRDERHGWTGDGQIFCRTASYNMETVPFYTKWLTDLTDAQQPTGAFPDFAPFTPGKKTEYGDDDTYNHLASAGWADAPVIVAWAMYEVYGDRRLMENHYDALAKWVEFCAAMSPDGIRTDMPQYGDWLSLPDIRHEERLAQVGDSAVGVLSTTPYDVFSTAYMAYSANLMSRIAATLGRPSDEARFSRLFGHIRSAFQAAFVSEDGTVKGDTQTAYAMALYMDLLPEELRGPAVRKLVERIEENGWHMMAGIHGMKYVMAVLTEFGYDDVAIRLVEQETYPSWLYSVKQGATTIWERWDGWTEEKGFQRAGMNSFNHYALGAVGEWLYGNLGGIQADPANPGFQRFVIRPRIGGSMTHASSKYRSLYGEIVSEWNLDGRAIDMRIVIPPNTSAKVYVPVRAGGNVYEGAAPLAGTDGIAVLGREGDSELFILPAGSYSLRAEM